MVTVFPGSREGTPLTIAFPSQTVLAHWAGGQANTA